MKVQIRTLLVTAGLSLALVPAVRSEPQSSAEHQLNAHARLEQAALNIESRVRAKTGASERDALRKQKHEIEAAIRRLETGQSLSPSEIDRILGEVTFQRAD
jgi:hypothetical protein